MNSRDDELPAADRLPELERSLLDPGSRTGETASGLLADDFVEFGASGRTFNKAQTVEALAKTRPVSYETDGFRVRLLAPNVALLTYTVLRHSDPPVKTLRCSIWRKDGGRWRMVFHQGTPVAPRDRMADRGRSD